MPKDFKVDKAVEFEIQYINCDCEDPEHLMIVGLEKSECYKILTFNFLLNNKLNFFQRVKLSLKYIFGFKYVGEMHEIIVNKENAKKINSIIEDYLK